MIEILDPATDATRIAALLAPGSGYTLTDAWDTALDELAVIEPATPPGRPRYIVFDWRGIVVRLPDPEIFWRLRTARNRYLIDEREQRRWADALIGIAGLSVGASALSVCALTGARRFRLAEFDTLGTTNLNRLSGSVCDLGVEKLTLAQRRVLELDPYTSIDAYPQGYTAEMAPALLGGDGTEPLAVLIEEMDDLAAKVDIRARARAARIPVLMATDNGDNAILDVERFDLDPGYPLFHGRAGDLSAITAEDLTVPRRRATLAQRIVGTDITPRTRFSLTEVGRSLVSWPQLGTAATVAGAVAAYAARLVATGHPLPSGRYRVDLDIALRGAEAAEANAWNEMSEPDFHAALTAMAEDARP